MVDLTISIVTGNNKDQLKECLNSIYNSSRGFSFEIYIVDNASDDGTKEMLSRGYKDVKLIINKKKMSFAYNHNSILKVAKGEYIIILNDDTLIPEGSFEKMINFLKGSPDTGVVGPKTKSKEGNYRQSAFRFPNLLDLFADYFFNKIKQGNQLAALYKNIEIVKRPKEIDWLLGACLIIPQKIIKKAGYLDEDFEPIYMEDADFCRRVKNIGYKVIYYPEAEIIHYGAQTTKKQELFMQKTLYKNRLKYFKKHYGLGYYFISKFVLYFTTLCNIIFDALRCLFLRITTKELLKNIREYIYILN